MKCKCGKIITEEQDIKNKIVANETNTPKLDICDECWVNYCNHAVTGE